MPKFVISCGMLRVGENASFHVAIVGKNLSFHVKSQKMTKIHHFMRDVKNRPKFTISCEKLRVGESSSFHMELYHFM